MSRNPAERSGTVAEVVPLGISAADLPVTLYDVLIGAEPITKALHKKVHFDLLDLVTGHARAVDLGARPREAAWSGFGISASGNTSARCWSPSSGTRSPNRVIASPIE